MANGNVAPRATVIGSNIAMAIATSSANTDAKLASARPAARAMVTGSRSTRPDASSAAAAAQIMASPSQRSARFVRGTRAAATADPIARPAMNATSIALNAYVVGPSVIASTRVQMTSYVNATKPEMARRKAGSRTPRRGPFRSANLGGDSICGLEGPAELRTTAPSAVMTFSTMPTSVAPNKPNDGRRTNPVSAAPIAAPTVLAAYSSAASLLPTLTTTT